MAALLEASYDANRKLKGVSVTPLSVKTRIRLVRFSTVVSPAAGRSQQRSDSIIYETH